MSGNTKRILYRVVSTLLYVCAVGGAAALFAAAYWGLISNDCREIWQVIDGAVALFLIIFFPLEAVVHEFGHLLCGWLVGFRFVSVSVNGFSFGRGGFSFRVKRDFAGNTQMLPKSAGGLRGRCVFYTFGGALLNLVYGVVFLTLFFLVPVSPVLLFFELLAPLNLYEGIAALIPCELPAGRTDGKVVQELVRDTPYAQVFLAVFRAQGILRKETYTEVSRELLFDLPVIREDDPVFLALMQLRWQYLFWCGDEDGAMRELMRLKRIGENTELPEEILCDVAYGECVFVGEAAAEAVSDKSVSAARTGYAFGSIEREVAIRVAKKERFFGIRALELKLIERVKGK